MGNEASLPPKVGVWTLQLPMAEDSPSWGGETSASPPCIIEDTAEAQSQAQAWCTLCTLPSSRSALAVLLSSSSLTARYCIYSYQILREGEPSTAGPKLVCELATSEGLRHEAPLPSGQMPSQEL